MQSRAVVIAEAGRVELQTVKLCEPGPDDVIIETAYTSISAGTERMLLAGAMPHPMLQLPVVPGYETVGRVVEVGDNAPAALQDAWVYVGGSMCYEGINAAWGGQSATIITRADRVVRVDTLPEPRLGVLLALSATALHGIDVLEVAEGQRVLILGQGPVGQLAARIASARGAWVAVTDRSPSRLQHAQGDVVVNVDEAALQDAVGDSVDVLIEAAGSMPALTDALPLLANGGTIGLLGYYQTLEIPYMPLFLKEARLLTAKEWAPGDLVRCRDMIAAGDLDVASLLTHTLPIDAVAAAYETAMNDMDCLKLVLEWHNEP